MATGSFKFKGEKKFMKNLNKEIRQLRGRTHRGLVEAAIILQREAEPETPLDLGNLRSSWFIVSYKTGTESKPPSFKESEDMSSHHQNVTRHARSLAQELATAERPVVVFGYSASYAPFVHENVGASFKRDSARARWLFSAMQRSKSKMLQAIKKHASF